MPILCELLGALLVTNYNNKYPILFYTCINYLII